MSRDSGNLVVTVVIAAVCGAVTLLASDTLAVRLVAALPLLFILPGYAVTAALFPKHSLGIPEKALFSVGLSVAVVIVGGFALHWTPWGLQTGSWVGLLFCVTLAACLVASKRWREQGPIAGMSLKIGFDFRQALLLGLAMAIIAAAVVLARTPMPPQGVQGYTMLWILPDSDGNPNVIRLGISCMEFAPVEYSLRVLVEGQVVHEWPSIELQPGEKWETNATLSENLPGKVEAILYRLNMPNDVYRRVTLRR